MAHFPDRDALKALVVSYIGGTPRVLWDGEVEEHLGFAGLGPTGAPSALAKPAAKVTLTFTSVAPHGVDDTRRELNGGTNLLDVTDVGTRHITLTVKIECDMAIDAAHLAERIRNAFTSRGGARLLREENIAVRSVSNARPFTVGAWGNGATDGVILEVFLAFASSAPDAIGEAEPAGNWIETADDPTLTEI